MSKPTVTVVGSTNLDITATVHRLPGPGETLLGRTLVHSPGGKGGNQALAASRAGANVRFITAVGSDEAAREAHDLLAADGVDLGHVLVREDEPTGTAIITVDQGAENTIIVIAGANQHLDAGAVQARAAAIEGVVVLQGEIPVTGIQAAFAAAEDRVVFNLAPVIDVPADLILRADPLVVNEHEGAGALTMLGGNPDGLSDEEIVHALKAAGVRSVVMTLGANGSHVIDNQGEHKIPAHTVTPVDTTGAGDAYVGALAARLAAGDSLADAAAYATRYAADTVTRAGAQASYGVLPVR